MSEMIDTSAPPRQITPTCPVFERWLGHRPDWDLGLNWTSRGMGALRVSDPPYDRDYFQNYQKLADTEMGHRITQARLDLVRVHAGNGHVVDVGIGSGAFIDARGGWTWGYDINPHGIRWLQNRARWRDPYEAPVSAVTLWDVLEHIPEPARLLNNVMHWVFISGPVVPSGGPPASDWKHFKPREHCWYWTRNGLVDWMQEYGFRCVSSTTVETKLGRQDIGTFAFERMRRVE